MTFTKLSIPTLTLTAAALFSAWPSALAKRKLFTNAVVHTVSGPIHSPGFVLTDGDTIEATGPTDEQPDAGEAKVVNLKGQHLFPGLIAPTTALGLAEIPAVRATVDTSEVGAYTPEVKSWLAINPDSELIPVARANGITHFLPIPQGGTVTGQSGLMATAGWGYEEMLCHSPVALHLFWPSMRINPAADDGKKQARQRDERLKKIDDFFEESRAYAKSQSAPEHEGVPAWDAMLPWVRGEKPLIIHANSQMQIESAVKWSTKRDWKPIIAGGRDAWRVAELLAKHNVPVIFEHTFTLPIRDFDRYDAQFRAAGTLHKAGVKIVFSEGLPGYPLAASNVRNLPYSAAQSAAHGLPRDVALKGITLHTAEILGVAKRLGSIEAGKEATFFTANGDILEIRTQVKQMWIAGKKVSLDNRHNRLYRKYRNRPKPKKPTEEKHAVSNKLPEHLDLPAFYKKSTNVNGFPIVSSGKVSDYALKEAAHLVDKMIGHRQDIIDNMIRRNCRLVVMAHEEFTTQVPEHSHLSPAKFWDRRARGLGSSRTDPVASCAEENLLCYPGDPYSTENILIHEFAHAIHLNGIYDVDPTFDRRLATAYEASIANGLWKGKYAAKNKAEYWAEGVQSWFNTNRPPDHDHNHVNTREELKKYDPGLAKLTREIFGDTAWRYKRPSQRNNLAHLHGFDPLKAPTFRWPERLQKESPQSTREQKKK
ncbi:MAG: amidohydrolase family protein [Verrucomicrobiota bacterium]|jgi:imidazolonepropionase-like amidohydrolase|nr:amidohydrolase family protein [Verrucomicrobiota bacterium]MDP7051748.1 amidohydrolase family protein [Verrucomicrobiota bacterium]